MRKLELWPTLSLTENEPSYMHLVCFPPFHNSCCTTSTPQNKAYNFFFQKSNDVNFSNLLEKTINIYHAKSMSLGTSRHKYSYYIYIMS
jgi:hypothetical protein